tara:strand:- start:74 stop:676 length:603 start_codon:yes stop_codon:yes gene_type:complete
MVDNLRLLFGTPILQTSLAVQHRILEFVKSQKFEHHGNGYFTYEYILESPEMQSVKNYITQKVKEYLYGDCGISEQIIPELVTSWVNLHKKGDWSHQHSHYNSVVSGVWYLSTTPESGEFLIHPDNKLFGNLLDLPKRVYNEFNVDQYAFLPKNGDMLIFPSTMRHSVRVNNCDNERLSLAFNYMIRGDVISGKSTKVKL